MILWAAAALALMMGSATAAREPAGLHAALDRLTRDGKFSGAVVIRDSDGVRFARGYGMADPFAGRAFTPGTPVDSGSLAKPVTAASVLLLAADGSIDLDAPVRRYLAEYPHAETTVRHLLAHSAGLELVETPIGLAGKTNAALLADAAGSPPLFAPGSGFTYCNLCFSTLALLVERVSGKHYLDVAQTRAALPRAAGLRPMRLADWKGRAIGYRRTGDGTIERFDSWDGEAFYGTANLSISAAQLAQWGSAWWKPPLSAVRPLAVTPAAIAGNPSGLTWGNWYCAQRSQRCHYLGHHEGFHHMLYWDADKRISIAMVSNNALAPGLQQRLQRALVAFAEGSPAATRELDSELPDAKPQPGRYRLNDGDIVEVRAPGDRMVVRRSGIDYPAYRIGAGIRYVPGLDLYLAGEAGGQMRWLTLYEDVLVRR